MIPKTTTIQIKRGVFYIKHLNLLINEEEAKSIGAEIKKAHFSSSIKAIIVDNSDAKGVWRPEANKIWNEIAIEIKDSKKKSVTLTNGALATIQINRLAKQNKMQDRIKAFDNGLTNEVWEFLGIIPVNFN